MSIQHPLSCATFGAVAAVAAASTQAGVIVTEEGGVFPTNPAVVTQASSPEEVFDNNSDPDFWAQSFTVDAAFQMDRIYFAMENHGVSGSGADSFEFELYQVADVNAATLTINEADDLFSGLAYTFSRAANSNYEVVELDLTGADELMLEASQGTSGYAFVIRIVSGGANWFKVIADAGTGYTGGTAYDNGGVEGPAGDDVDFVLGVTAVPEPASLALLGAGGLFMLRRRR